MKLTPPLVLRTGQRLVIDVEEWRVLVRVDHEGDADELRATLFSFLIPPGSEWVMSDFGDPRELSSTDAGMQLADTEPEPELR